MSSPTLSTFAAAATSAYHTGTSSVAGLSVFTDSSGKALTITSANGCTATAYQDSSGHVIIAFQGTSTSIQDNLDSQIMGDQAPSTIAGFADAMNFTKTVEDAATSKGVLSSDISVTGHSLGGALAEYVASQTGLPGVSFAGCGVPGLSNSGSVTNFVSYVESGDPFANRSSDSEEAAITNAHTDHYGTVVHIGSAAGKVDISTLVSNIEHLPFAILTGQGAQAMATITNETAWDMASFHGLTTYLSDLAALSPSSAGSAAFISGMATTPPKAADMVTSASNLASLAKIVSATTGIDAFSSLISSGGLAVGSASVNTSGSVEATQALSGSSVVAGLVDLSTSPSISSAFHQY